MRKSFLFVLFIFLFFSNGFSGEKYRVAVLEPYHSTAVSKSKLQILVDILESELGKTFTVISRKDIGIVNTEQYYKRKNQLMDDLHNKKFNGVDKILVFDIQKFGSRYYLSVKLLDVETAQSVGDSTKVRYQSDIPDALKKMVSKIKYFGIKVDYEDIKALLELKEYKQARSKLNIYMMQNGTNDQATELLDILNKNQAVEHYQHARKLFSKQLYPEAMKYIKLAVSYNPEKKDFQRFKTKIQKKLDEKRNMGNKERAEDIHRKAKALYAQSDLDSLREALRLSEKSEDLVVGNFWYSGLTHNIKAKIQQRKKEIRQKEEWDAYWRRRERNISNDGFTLSGVYSVPRNEILSQYYISRQIGIAAGMDVAFGKFFTWYNRLQFIGLYTEHPGVSKESLDFSYFSTGFRLHYLLLTIFDPYVQLALNWIGISGDTTNMPPQFVDGLGGEDSSMGFEYGVGMKIVLTTKLGVFGETMWYNNTIGSQEMGNNTYRVGFFFGF